MMFEPPQHVIDAYKEPHRKYHNLDHIESILAKIPLFVSEYGLDSKEDSLIQLLAWYHDAFYEPGNSMNEARSADLLWIDVKDHWNVMSGTDRQMIYDAVLGTKSHKLPSSWLGAIFFDLDLADMGTDSYVENSFKIREEFSEFSDLEWLAGRQKFLSDFLSRPFIYHTSLGYKLWEERARFNMMNELFFLKGKYGF